MIISMRTTAFNLNTQSTLLSMDHAARRGCFLESTFFRSSGQELGGCNGC